jgi:predicted transcriptional regulator
MAQTKTEVREKLKELHQQAANGVRPRQHYTVNDALDDWLETGLDGLAPATATAYRNTIAKALREEPGTVELTKLTAAAVQKALAAMAAGRSTRTVQMAHNVLVRAIRHAERDDLVGRNVAALVKPPKGQPGGRPSKALTLEQAVALIAAAQGTRLEASCRCYPVCGLRRRGRCGGITWWRGFLGSGFRSWMPASITSRWRCSYGGLTGPGVTPRRRSRGGRWRCRVSAWRRCGSIGCGRHRTGSWPGHCGRITGWCSRRRWGRRWMTKMCGGCSGRSRRTPG